MEIHPFQAVYPNIDFIASADSFFKTVKEDYTTYRKNNFFQKAGKEAIFIHQIKTNERTYWGIITCVNIMDYLNGNILKHESTLAEKEQYQMQLLLNREAMVKPILLTYPDIDEINNTIQSFVKKKEVFYSISFDAENSVHNFWQVADGKTIQKFQKLFKAKVPFSYIADGHHRSAATGRIFQQRKKISSPNPYKHLLCAFFPSSQLDIFDYNRIVEGLTNISTGAFVAKLSKVFDIDVLAQPTKPKRKNELVMLLDQEWYRLKWKKSILANFDEDDIVLDVSLLNEKVLKGILNIGDVRMDTRVKYIEGPKGMEMLKNKTFKSEHRIAFLLFPVQLNDLMAIAEAGKVLPPKSTWFEPRVKNGLLVYEF